MPVSRVFEANSATSFRRPPTESACRCPLDDPESALLARLPDVLRERLVGSSVEMFSDDVIAGAIDTTSVGAEPVLIWLIPPYVPLGNAINDNERLAVGSEFSLASIVEVISAPGSRSVPAERWVIAARPDGHHLAERTHPINPQRAVELLVGALDFVHSLDVLDDHVRWTPNDIVEVIQRELGGRAVPRPELSAAYRHMDVDRLVTILSEGIAHVTDEPTVRSHGRASLRQVVSTPERSVLIGAIPGIVMSPISDLVAAATDVAIRFGPMLVPTLFEAAGRSDVDPLAVDWWALAHELLRLVERGPVPA